MKKNVLLQTILLCHLPCYSGSSLHLSLQCRRFFKSIYPCISIVESSPSRVEWRRNSECVLVNQREDGISLVGVCVEQAQCVLWPFADFFFFFYFSHELASFSRRMFLKFQFLPRTLQRGASHPVTPILWIEKQSDLRVASALSWRLRELAKWTRSFWGCLVAYNEFGPARGDSTSCAGSCLYADFNAKARNGPMSEEATVWNL